MQPRDTAALAPPNQLAFLPATPEDPHRARARELLERHPEIRALFGPDRRTAALAAGIVAAQLAMGLALARAEAPLVAVVAAAWLVGAHAAHALLAVIHEATHGRVFGSASLDRPVLLLANVPLVVPFAVPLSHWHLVHHRALGQEGRDPDLPAAWERRWFGRGVASKVAWQVLFPFVQAFRTTEPRDAKAGHGSWFAAGVAVQLGVVGLTVWMAGALPIVYWGASLFFVFALHPLSGRLIQEHFIFDERRETGSYHGALSRLCLHFGHHAEHHDFPAIAWSRLPALTRIAPEAYPGFRSWGRLWLRFLFDRRVTLASRLARPASEPRADDGAPPAPAVMPARAAAR
jgi:sphingolipid 4-desaturase/C4-monooxygenase